MIYLVFAVAILAIAGTLFYSQSSSGKKAANKEVSVEVVDPIKPDFDQSALAQLRDNGVAKDFSVPINLNDLGNPNPYGP
jgi:hypothetical protein